MTQSSYDVGTIREHGASNSGLNLGGIGTGGVELWPDGRFHFWNLVNARPWAKFSDKNVRGKGNHALDPVVPEVGDTDFFVRIQHKGARPRYRWLFTGHGLTVASGHFYRHHKYFFIKSCAAIDYRAEYPFIHLHYLDDEFPLDVRLRAWTPFVPRDVKSSSLPGFYLDFTCENRSRDAMEVSLVWQQRNLAGYATDANRQEHAKRKIARAHAVVMRGNLDEPDHDSSGSMTIWALPGKGQTVTSVACNPHMPNLIWPVHVTGGLDGPLMPERITREELAGPGSDVPNKGWLCVRQRLKPGQSTEMNLGMAWHFPHHRSIRGTYVGHVYSNWFDDAADVAEHMISRRDKLLDKARLMPELMMRSDLPETLKLALLDQLNTLTKSTHYIESGRFGLQEGLGCCAFNTVDVDHYSSYALSLVQPDLREQVLDQQTALAHPRSGKIHHGLPGTVEEIAPGGEQGYNRWDCCCQYALQVYRDTKWAGRLDALKRYWPTVKRAMEVIAGLDFYDVGLPYIEGGITYDHWRMKGVVTYMAGVYLAALRATREMAATLGDHEAEALARDRFERGLASFEKFLWNGSQYLLYYTRVPEGEQAEYRHEGEEGHLEAQQPPACCRRPEACVEIKDTGVMTDVINGNATAAVMGLGSFLKTARVRRHLRLVLERNHQEENACVINGSYPDGHFLDGWPFMQWQTPWTGTEYFLAAQLYAAGMVAPGDDVVRWVHERHVREGMRFDHSECNNHYARPLSIWAAYAARLGLDVDAIHGRVALRPRFRPGAERRYTGLMLTATMTGWLDYQADAKRTSAAIEARDGKQPIKEIVLATAFAPRLATVKLDGKKLPAELDARRNEATVTLGRKITLKTRQKLQIKLKA
jgi:uncharacterized protein (DUF608 family)